MPRTLSVFLFTAVVGGALVTGADAQAFTREYTCEGGLTGTNRHCEVLLDSDQPTITSVTAYLGSYASVTPCAMYWDRVGMFCGSTATTNGSSSGNVTVNLTGAWDCSGLPCGGNTAYPFLVVNSGVMMGYQVTN